jgi:hypothetical protein
MNDARQLRAFAVQDWWSYQDLQQGTREQRVDLERAESPLAQRAQRAYDGVQNSVELGGTEALDVVEALITSAPDADAVAVVSAGPLEELVYGHGAALIDDIERRARQDSAFANALRSIWLDHGALPSEVEARLEKWVRVGNSK